MTSKLPDYLKDKIKRSGPITIAAYMGDVLGHPEHGYYMTRDPLGRGGDFTTAPEVSQMFGEVLGAYFAYIWRQMGSPEAFTFLECGPGRGTLMADMMRAASVMEGFHAACDIHLLETSPVLREKQAEALGAYSPVWHDDLSTVPRDKPVLVVGNEFIDALPVHQLEMSPDGWRERYVDYAEGQGFHFMLKEPSIEVDNMPLKAVSGDVYEIEPERIEFFERVCDLMKANSGAALFIDYGHIKSDLGDTLQAVYRHEYCSILEHMGDADLTAHVDFEVLAEVAKAQGVFVSDIVTQGEFLQTMGMAQRAQDLCKNGSPDQVEEIKKALHRLTHADEMGALFKVMGLSYG